MVPITKAIFGGTSGIELGYNDAIYPTTCCLRGGGADPDLHTRCIYAPVCV